MAVDDTGAVAVEEFEALVAAAGEAPPAEVQEQLAPPPAPAAVASEALDEAAIPYPKGVDHPPQVAKFAGKTVKEISDLISNTERSWHEKNREVTRLAEEKRLLETRIAAAEQVTRMLPATPAEPEAPKERLADIVARREGFDSAERAYWADPVGFNERLEEARREERDTSLRKLIAEETGKVKDEVFGGLSAREQQAQDNERYFNTWESAKAAIRAQGRDLSDEQWVRALHYIAPQVRAEAEVNPEARFDSNRYVQHFLGIVGAPPKAVLPTEGAPAAAAQPVTTPRVSERAIPTISNEERAKRQALADTFVENGHMTKEEAQIYIAGGAN